MSGEERDNYNGEFLEDSEGVPPLKLKNQNLNSIGYIQKSFLGQKVRETYCGKMVHYSIY